MAKYQYKPIRHGHLRLVELVSGDGDLEIRLHEREFERTGPYSFLSYAWGSSGNDEKYKIRCEAGWIKVPRNLRNFLLEFRRGYRGLLLWIDAICINQEDMDERNIQVKLLPQINRLATSTICWVDAPRFNRPLLVSRLVADLLRISRLTLFRNSPFLYLNHDPSRSGAKITPEQLRLFQSETENIDPGLWEALEDFLSDGYFRRMWISLDWYWSKELLFRYGSVTIAWNDLCLALGLCFRFSFRNRLTSAGFYNLLVMDLVRKRNLVHHVRPTLYEVFSTWHSCDLQTSVVNDKVFAPLSIVQEDGVPRAIKIDYAQSNEDIYCQVASALGVLSLSLAKRSSVALSPTSWVPDWGVIRKHFLLSQSDTQFSASPNARPDFITDLESHTLKCRGIIADKIKATSNYLPPRRPCDHYIASGANSIIFEEWFEFARDYAKRLRRIPYDETKLLFKFTETIQARGSNTIWEVEWDDSNIAGRMRDFLHLIDDEDAIETVETRLFYAACFPSHGRRFGITERGYYCLLPPEAKAADLVCLVYGNNVPILFRQHISHYQNLGECYVNGLMHHNASVLGDCQEVMFNIV